jgi:hypothetical protein
MVSSLLKHLCAERFNSFMAMTNIPTPDFLLEFTVFVIAYLVSIFAFIHNFRKIRQKGYRWRIATLITLAGFLFGVIVAGLVAYLFGGSVFTSEKTPDWLAGLGVLSVLTAAVISGVPLVAGIATLLPNRRARIAAGERTEWKLDLKLAYILAALFLVPVPVLLIWRPPELELDDPGSLFAVILVLGLYGGIFFVVARKLAKRVAAARYLEPSQTSETPILFLREFEHERRPFIFRSVQPRHPVLEFFWPWYLPPLTLIFRSEQPCFRSEQPRHRVLEFFSPSISMPFTLEQYLSPALESELAPLVALGRPQDYLPPSGATRDYLEDQSWQERFEDLAARSKAILMLPGSSESLTWELSFLLSTGLASKLFIVFGPLAFSRPKTDPEWMQKLTRMVWYEPLDWSRFVAATRTAGYNLGAQVPTPPAVLAFDRKGNGYELSGSYQTPQDYVRAVRSWLMGGPMKVNVDP